MDLIGIARTIDHAVYTLLNALAIVLWRLDAALMGVSILSYSTQDWLTGRSDGGIWFLLSRLVGPEGFFGLGLWEAFLLLALSLAGLSRILRPFLRLHAVDLGRLLFFAAVAYVFLTQGSELLQGAEQWRLQAGSFIYQVLADKDAPLLDVPGSSPDPADPIFPPRDLDGQPPIRGWEAVAGSYFLAETMSDLHAGVPPRSFRVAYCLYDPTQPVGDQAEENAAGCSPRKAWDEWDLVSTQPITQVWGIPLPIDLSLSLPVVQEHPENRELGIRQAQAGVARLVLGLVVALFPIIEANVGLMLTLAAGFIYLSLPIVLLFGFFLQTESLVTRLLMQFLGVFLRTLILQGIVGLFLLILVGVAAQGSLTAYLGLIGVGLLGGFFLTRLAAATMQESLSQAMGAVGGVWMGASVGLLGEGARRPAQAVLGAAKLAAGGAAMAAAASGSPTGIGAMAELAEPAAGAARSGWGDLHGRSEPGLPLTKTAMPAAIAALSLPRNDSQPALGAQLATRSRNGRQSYQSDSTSSHTTTARSDQSLSPATWAERWYQAQDQGHGLKPIQAQGRTLFGEELNRAVEPVLARRDQAQVQDVLTVTRQVRQQENVSLISRDGRVTRQGLQRVREQLSQETVQAFSDEQGQRDLAVLVAAGAQPQRTAPPAAFRRATAAAKLGGGDEVPARSIPHRLGLDPVASGEHAGPLNRFTRLSEQASLSQTQRERLLAEAQQGRLSVPLRNELTRHLSEQGQTAPELKELVTAAQALPETLSGPQRIRLGHQVAKAKPLSQEAKDTPPPTDPAVTPKIVSQATATESKRPSLAQDLKQPFTDPTSETTQPASNRQQKPAEKTTTQAGGGQRQPQGSRTERWERPTTPPPTRQTDAPPPDRSTHPTGTPTLIDQPSQPKSPSLGQTLRQPIEETKKRSDNPEDQAKKKASEKAKSSRKSAPKPPMPPADEAVPAAGVGRARFSLDLGEQPAQPTKPKPKKPSPFTEPAPKPKSKSDEPEATDA